jgi:hypothetical protein
MKLKSIALSVLKENIDQFALSLSPSSTFEKIMNSMVGKKLNELSDKVSMYNLYLGNKYGVGPDYSEKDFQNFLNGLKTYFYKTIIATKMAENKKEFIIINS